jgi:hypothetical protein
MFRNIARLLPQESMQNLRHHKFFEYKTYGEKSKESVENFKNIICDELVKAGKIDDRSVRGYSKIVDRYVNSTNGLEELKSRLQSIIEKRSIKKECRKRLDFFKIK